MNVDDEKDMLMQKTWSEDVCVQWKDNRMVVEGTVLALSLLKANGILYLLGTLSKH